MIFTAITLCVVSQRVFIVAVCFVIDSVRKLLDTPSYACNFVNKCALSLKYMYEVSCW
jgi:hypothetical protein